MEACNNLERWATMPDDRHVPHGDCRRFEKGVAPKLLEEFDIKFRHRQLVGHY